MKKIVTAVICLLILGTSFVQVKAQDGIFSDAQTLGSGQASLGIQPVFFTQAGSDDFMLILRAAYGLEPGLAIHGKVGVLREETYLGGHFEYMLAGEPYDPLSFSLIGGIYSLGDIGLKVGGIFSRQFGSLSLYSGLTFEPLFTDPEEITPLLLPLGIDVPISGERTNLVFEADLALNADAERYEALHLGFNFYF